MAGVAAQLLQERVDGVGVGDLEAEPGQRAVLPRGGTLGIGTGPGTGLGIRRRPLAGAVGQWQQDLAGPIVVRTAPLSSPR